LQEQDFLARFDGDDLALLSTSACADGPALARRAARAFAVPFVIDGHTVRISASIGAASAPSDGATTVDLMRCADLALHEAKRQGRDRAILYSPEIERRRRERRALERDLRAALKGDELRLCYQPIVTSGTNRVVALEALLRWNHPTGGEVSPGAFIPIAEQCGLMPELGDWVLHRAMADAKRWPALQISINLSPVQVRHVDLEALLRRMLDEHGVEARRFVLEITEGIALDANGRTKRMLEAVRALGFKTALDDFGAGHSSLAYLHDFKFDKIKIDRSLTNGGETARAIAQAAATLGRALKMDVVAEGVETEAEAVLMRHLGCTELQGYFFSRPVEAADVDALLRKYERPRLTYAGVPADIVAARAS
jgi:predicted signal transduction protein with EAL and GGDEF domain